MENLFSALWRLFSQRTVVFTGPSAAVDARTLRQQQHALYGQLIQRFSGLSFTDTEEVSLKIKPGPPEKQVFDWIVGAVPNLQPVEDAKPDGRVILRGEVPILTEGKLADFLSFMEAERFAREDADRITASLAGAILAETSTRKHRYNFDSIPADWKVNLLSAVAAYSAAKTVLLHETSLVTRYEAELATLKGSMANATSSLEKERADQRLALDSLSAAATEIDDKQHKASDAIEETRARLTNFENTIRAELQLDRARLSWEGRFKEARGGFWVACGLLALSMVVTLLGAFFYGPAIISYLNRPSFISLLTGGSAATAVAHQVGRLVIISFPIVVFLWLLRVLIRYFMRSMLLMDDARQRQTMLDTYFLLSAQGRADERDRPLILWALFRQTPGHGPDGIDPPDFTEVINAGFNRSRTPPQ